MDALRALWHAGRRLAWRFARAPSHTVGVALSFSIGLWLALLAAGGAVSLVAPPPGVASPQTVRRVLITRKTVTGYPTLAPVISYHELRALQRAASPSLVEAYSVRDVSMRVHKTERRVRASPASVGLLQMLGVRLERGRFPIANEDGDPRVALIGFHVWRDVFQLSNSAIGAIVYVDGQAFTIIGITAPAFVGLDAATTDIWLPAAHPVLKTTDERNSFALSAVTRVSPRDDPRFLARRLMNGLRDGESAPDQIADLELAPIPSNRLGTSPIARRALAYALALAGGVLLLAIANCALFTAGHVERRRAELRARFALGATTSRLAFHVAGDLSVLLCVTAALVLATFNRSAALLGVMAPLPYRWDWRILTLCALGILLLWAMAAVFSAMACVKNGMRGPSSGRVSSFSIRRWIVGLYVGLTSALAIAAVPIVYAGIRVMKVRPGFEPKNLVVVTTRGDEPDPQLVAMRSLLRALKELPFAAAVAASSGAPYRASTTATVARFRGNRSTVVAQVYEVLGDVPRALGIPVEAGTVFTDDASPLVVVVNRAFSRLWWKEPSLGTCVYVDGDRCSSLAAVVGDADVTALGEPARPVVYTPMKRLDREATVFLFVRTRSSITAANLSAISGLVKGFVPGASARVELMPDIVRQQSAAARIGVSLTGLLIAIAFLLAACGLYANCEIAVQRRRHELGVRAALGATPARLIATLGSELAIVVAIGSVAGLILGNWMTGLLFFVLTELPIHVRVAQLFAMLVMPMLLLLTSVVPALRLSRCAPRTLMMEAE